MYIVILLNLGFDIWLKIRRIEEISEGAPSDTALLWTMGI